MNGRREMRQAGSHSVSPPMSAHPVHGFCTRHLRPQRKAGVQIASPWRYWHAPYTVRAPEGGPLTAPEKQFARHDSACFGTPFTKNAPHAEFQVRPKRRMRQRPQHPSTYLSHGACPTGKSTDGPRDELASRRLAQVCPSLRQSVPHRELHLRHQEEGSHGFLSPIPAHPSHRLRSTGSTAHGLSGRIRAMATLFTGIAPRIYARELRCSPLSAHTHTDTHTYIQTVTPDRRPKNSGSLG